MYQKEIADAQKSKAEYDELERIKSGFHNEFGMLDDEERGLHTSHLVRIASNYMLPIPRDSEEERVWEQSDVTGDRWLTPEARVRLREAIRKEEKERRESVLAW